MTNRDETLQAIEDCGAAEMAIDETCLICQIEEEIFLADAEMREAYKRGQLKTKMQIRQAVVKMAREGVPQMVKIYQDFSKIELPELEPALEDEFLDELPDLPENINDEQ